MSARTSRSLRRVSRQSPSFDLVVATVGRSSELARFLESLEAQAAVRVEGHRRRSERDDRVDAVLAATPLRIVGSRRRVCRGPERGPRARRRRRRRVPRRRLRLSAGLLRRVGERLAATRSSTASRDVPWTSTALGRPRGRSDAAILTDDNLWNRAISFTIFLRQPTVEQVGPSTSDSGSGRTPWHSGEEIDYLIRAIDGGARIEYDPTLVVEHDVRADDARRTALGMARASATCCGSTRYSSRWSLVCSSARRAPVVAPPPRHDRSPVPARTLGAASAATSERSARRAPRDDRATARARSASPLGAEPRLSTRRQPQDAVTASASASGSGGSSRSNPSGWTTPIPASSPTSSGTPRSAGTRRVARRPSPRSRRSDTGR